MYGCGSRDARRLGTGGWMPYAPAPMPRRTNRPPARPASSTPPSAKAGTTLAAAPLPKVPLAIALPFAAATFLGAFLLFLVQPLIARYILPWFGGGPGVWTTCMLFFQAVLLAGYGYAHLGMR